MSMNLTWKKNTIKGKPDEGKMVALGNATKKTEDQNLVIDLFVFNCLLFSFRNIIHVRHICQDIIYHNICLTDYESNQYHGVQDTISEAAAFHSSNMASLHIFLAQFLAYSIISKQSFL